MTESEIKSALRETRGDVQAAAELLASVKRTAKEMNEPAGEENTGKEEKPASPKGPLEPPIKRARTEETLKILAILMGERNFDGIETKAEALKELTIEKSALEELNRDYGLVQGTLPVQIVYFKNLKIFTCAQNKLKELPKEIGQLSQLGQLYCRDNQLTSLPKEIGQLSLLEEFDCSNNQLTSLPVEIGNLSNLQGFDCSNNELTSLPMEIGDLSNLRLLNCENNNLTSLPVEFAKLSYLRILTDLDLKIQERNWVMEKTIEVAQNKETMREFMEGVELGAFVMSLEGSNMFLIHFDKQEMDKSSAYVRNFLDFLDLPEYSRVRFIDQIRGYLDYKKDPHLLALVSVNDNTLLLNGFLLGTFLEEDFDYHVKKASRGRKNRAEISYLSTQKPSDEVSENYFSEKGSYYFGTMLIKIFESMARKAGKENLILESLRTVLEFYRKLGFTDIEYVSDEDPVYILAKEVSVPLGAPLWHRVLEARRSGMMAEAILLSRGNLVAAAQLVWHRIN